MDYEPIFSVLPEPDGAYLIIQLKRQEGLRLAAYADSLGILTIGYGHNCESSPVPGVSNTGDTITLEEAERIFSDDLFKSAVILGHTLPWLRLIAPARQAVLVNMAFNMSIGNQLDGTGLMGFRRMLKAVQTGDYVTAAREMLDSRWATQVGPRARELSRQMESGVWAAQYSPSMQGLRTGSAA